jgi:hypothetical protein
MNINKSLKDLFSSKTSINEAKEIKTMIILKSLVFGLFIVFVTLLIAFFIIRNQHLKKVDKYLKCSDRSVVAIDDKIERIEFQNNVIVVITSDKSGRNKSITRIDASCGNEINRINLMAKKK